MVEWAVCGETFGELLVAGAGPERLATETRSEMGPGRPPDVSMVGSRRAPSRG